MESMIETPNWLTDEEITIYGAFYTPEVIVEKVIELVQAWKERAVVLDPAAGCGAFIEKLIEWDYRAGEIDEKACEYLKTRFDPKRVICKDALRNVSRDKYGIPDDAFLMVVGNPPYNDWTSLYRKGKKGHFHMDAEVFDRDIGIAFLKAMAKLSADVICILHPMSYLIKRGNFKRLLGFFSQYRLQKAIVFPSFVFKNTSKTIGFPVIIAYYEKDRRGFTWQELLNFPFEFLFTESVFKLKDIETTDGFINKYPRRNLSPIGIYFHTFRDINSLLRNRDFLLEPTKNTIPLDLANFPQYAYLIALKHYILSKGAKHFWFYGNFSPLIDVRFFLNHTKDFVEYALRKTKALPEDRKNFLRRELQVNGSLDLKIVEEHFKGLFKYVDIR